MKDKQEYGVYHLSKVEICKYGMGYLLIFLVFGKLFYGLAVTGLIGSVLLPYLLKRKAKELAKKRRQQVVKEFRDLILSFSGALKTGYSVENAFREAYRDLQFMYEPGADILVECERICRQMENNMVLERLLEDFAQRSCVTDIMDFAAIFSIATRSGGNISKIVQNTAQMISDKIEVKEEIQIMFASKKMEQKIMNVIPVAIMLYIQMTSPGYFDALYKNLTGIVIMSACLVVYILSYFLSQKIMNIEV